MHEQIGGIIEEANIARRSANKTSLNRASGGIDKDVKDAPTNAPALPKLLLCAMLLRAAVAHSQELEPRAYSNLPVGLNFLIAGYAHSQGGHPAGGRDQLLCLTA